MVAVGSTLKITGHNNCHIHSSMFVNPLTSIRRKANNKNVQNALSLEKKLVNVCSWKILTNAKKAAGLRKNLHNIWRLQGSCRLRSVRDLKKSSIKLLSQ